MKPLSVNRLSYAVRPHFWSARRQILHSVDFEVQAGEMFGFLGPNGAGKTTTIKAILGLLRPDAGEVRVLGGSIRDPSIRARIGFLPERSYFPEHLTGGEVVLKHALLAGLSWSDAKTRCRSLLERVGMGHARDQLLRGYSKGMLQRIGVAQALVGRPDLVIFDEPMSGLDPLGRRDIREVLTELRASGTTVFFSTHILPDVEMLCDRVTILIQGRVRRTGRLDALLSDAVDRVEIHVDALPDPLRARFADHLAHDRGRDVILAAASSDEANRWIDELREHAVSILRVETHRGTLEDIFVKAAGESVVEGGSKNPAPQEARL